MEIQGPLIARPGIYLLLEKHDQVVSDLDIPVQLEQRGANVGGAPSTCQHDVFM